MMNEKALSPQDKTRQMEIIEAIASGSCVTESELMSQFGLSFYQCTLLLSDPGFISILSNFSKARANLAFHTRGVGQMIDNLSHPDPKVNLQAVKLLGQYTGTLKSKESDVNINVSLEHLVKESEKKVNSIDIDFTPKPMGE